MQKSDYTNIFITNHHYAIVHGITGTPLGMMQSNTKVLQQEEERKKKNPSLDEVHNIEVFSRAENAHWGSIYDVYVSLVIIL